jgi:hypothetical protein
MEAGKYHHVVLGMISLRCNVMATAPVVTLLARLSYIVWPIVEKLIGALD